jgi:hypothetical protein
MQPRALLRESVCEEILIEDNKSLSSYVWFKEPFRLMDVCICCWYLFQTLGAIVMTLHPFHANNHIFVDKITEIKQFVFWTLAEVFSSESVQQFRTALFGTEKIVICILRGNISYNYAKKMYQSNKTKQNRR